MVKTDGNSIAVDYSRDIRKVARIIWNTNSRTLQRF
jgi:hypothetical protein